MPACYTNDKQATISNITSCRASVLLSYLTQNNPLEMLSQSVPYKPNMA